MKKGIVIMNSQTNRTARWTLSRGATVLFLVGAGYISLYGCSVNADKEKLLTTTSQPEASSRPAQSEPSKETTLQAQAFTLQDLSVHEERGQTTLFVRFSQ